MYISNISSIKKKLIDFQSDDLIKSIMLFCADKDAPSSSDIAEVLQVNTKPLIGGIFPEIICSGVRYESGFLLIGLQDELNTFLFQEGDVLNNLIKEIKMAQIKNTTEHCTLFSFVNALWNEKKTFLTDLYDHLGPFVNYLGGGAGSLTFQSKPCVFYNQNVSENAAVIGLLKKKTTIGVAHGWKPITGPIKVTATDGNDILSLNWKPAFDVYKHLIQLHSGQEITHENFFEVAKSYPLGLVRFDDEMIIRDPYAATHDGRLKIVDEVPLGEYIRIMNGDILSLLNGATTALNESTVDSYPTTKFCIDCISRVLFLNNDFDKELAILNTDYLADGILSIGEIANPGNSTLEIFNKTIVVAQWKKTN